MCRIGGCGFRCVGRITISATPGGGTAMNVIEHPSAVDPTTLANQIEAWFTDHKFVTELSVSGNSAELLARRKNPARTAIGASRGIAVAIDASDDGTRIEIRAAEWKRNLIGPAVLAISTFGASALVPGWSRVLQKQLEHYVRSLLGPAEGPSELAIVEVIEGQRSERPIGDDVRTLDNSGSSSVLSRDLKITKRWSQTCSIDIEQTNTRVALAGSFSYTNSHQSVETSARPFASTTR